MTDKKIKRAIILSKRALVKNADVEQRSQALEERRQVIGADIYIQENMPEAAGNWVWIDTTGIDLIQ